MKRLMQLCFLCASVLNCSAADQRLIVRIPGGQTSLISVCSLLGCNIVRGLDDPDLQVFLISLPVAVSLPGFISSLSVLGSVQSIETDQLLKINQDAPPVPAALYDSREIPYSGVNVRWGYLNQPAIQILRVFEAQNNFGVSGRATVAVIDTGVDPNHPALHPVLLAGYDFTRNSENGSEAADVTQSTAAVIDGSGPTYVARNTSAVIDQSSANNLDTPSYADFGHGTMVSGVIHLIAPTARISPLKAFNADGSGYISDVIRAIYRAVKDNADIINMSFSTNQSSPELTKAVNKAINSGALCVAAAGNQGTQSAVYPAAISGVVSVASTTNNDDRSSFSNYGADIVWMAAPGEGVITTYPYGTYAAAWGTSFSTPFVAGTAALLLNASRGMSPSALASALGHAKPLTSDLAHGRLDVYSALQAALNQ